MANYCLDFNGNPLDRTYHDNEWGRPVHDDRQMMEHLSLEVMQCGLSWLICLKRREVFKKCFANFEIDRLAAMTDADVERIVATEGMIRAPRKVRAVINNARVAQQIIAECGSLCGYFWSFTDSATLVYDGHPEGRIPVSNGLSRRIATDLKRRGMTFVGPVNIYAHLQACGIINDHHRDCPIHAAIAATATIRHLPPDDEQF